MNSKVIIDAPSDDPMTTTVTLETGELVPGVAAVRVDIRPGKPNQATLEFCSVALRDVYAVADLSEFLRIVAGRMTTAERRKLISEINTLPPTP